MRFISGGLRFQALGLMFLVALVVAVPASAQWTRVAGIPATRLFCLAVDGDTIAAGADTTVFVSTNAGATWVRSTKPVSGVTSIQTVLIRNGRLFAGTFGQGAHLSDDLGATWHPFNDGLVGGPFNTQLDLVDLQARGDDLYAATAGAGIYVRNFAGPRWQKFGSVFEPNQASNVNSLALGGSRLLASAGSNGMVFRNDPGQTDWTISNLDNVGIRAGLQAQSAAWTGTGWVVGSNGGAVFRSVAGQEPWTLVGLGLGGLNWTAFAAHEGHLFAAFDRPNAAVMEESDDDGATWQNIEIQPGVFVQDLAISGDHLYAARADGLWRRPLTVTSVASDEAPPNDLQFALAGPQPFENRTSLQFDLPRAESISIELFDVQGRAVGDRIEGRWPSGRNQVTLNAERLGSGVYLARLTAGGKQEVIRLVHVR